MTIQGIDSRAEKGKNSEKYLSYGYCPKITDYEVNPELRTSRGPHTGMRQLRSMGRGMNSSRDFGWIGDCNRAPLLLGCWEMSCK
jgi:hypothetical protein